MSFGVEKSLKIPKRPALDSHSASPLAESTILRYEHVTEPCFCSRDDSVFGALGATLGHRVVDGFRRRVTEPSLVKPRNIEDEDVA